MSAPEDRIFAGSAGEGREYGLLLSAHANRELTADESRRLLDLAENHPERQSEIAAMDTLHDCFASERALRKAVGAPLEFAESGDESYRRLAAKAADAELQLRARLLHQPGLVARVGRIRGYLKPSIAALLVAGLCFWFLPRGDATPGLSSGTPDDSRLGGAGARIYLSAELSRSRPVFSWLPAVGASSYDAFIEDHRGVVWMRRSSALAGMNRWNLSSKELDQLAHQIKAREDRGGLFLRIVGRDGAGLMVATSGSLGIALVD